MKAAILADGTIAPLISNRVYSQQVPDNQKPPYITLVHSGNTPFRTAGNVMLELPHMTLNVFVQGQDSATLISITDAIVLLFKGFNTQSGGRSYTINRIFDMPRTDIDNSLMWSFEYLATITDS